MNREKQIEEMARVIHDSDKIDNNILPVSLSDCIIKHGGTRTNEAVALYNAGYRKQGDVIDEFTKKLKEAPIKCALPLFGLSTKTEIEEYFNDIMLQVCDAIDKVAAEMKGGEG